MEKILLVDDREDNLLSIAAVLEPGGYTFIKANSGRQALKILLKEFDFALILMDVQMPNLNGFETATLIYEREKLRHIPIIFITANNYGDENIFKGYEAGAVDYIYKPINTALLRAKVAVFIDLYKKNHRLVAQEKKLLLANEKLQDEVEVRKVTEKEIAHLNFQLMENIHQLKATNEELDHFAFIASHDLQEPLRKIRTFIDILNEKHAPSVDQKAGEYLTKIDKSAQRMQLLINDILTFSKFSGNSDGFEKTDLNLILEGVLSDLEVVIEEKKAVVTIQPLPSLMVVPGMIRQLLQNLASNALKFSKKDVVPTMTVRCEKIPGRMIPNITPGNEKKSYYAITVEDNGIGFEDQYADMIFVIFKRLHSSGEVEGTGIGLAICKKIAEKHGGFIYAKSKYGEGSAFTLALPVA